MKLGNLYDRSNSAVRGNSALRPSFANRFLNKVDAGASSARLYKNFKFHFSVFIVFKLKNDNFQFEILGDRVFSTDPTVFVRALLYPVDFEEEHDAVEGIATSEQMLDWDLTHCN
jgi:hypothetical protein